jgi:segregation and condensation protein B
MDRDWIRVLGYRDVPGKPALLGTTHEFLDYFNLKSLQDLPTLAEIKDIETIMPELNLEPKIEKDEFKAQFEANTTNGQSNEEE